MIKGWVQRLRQKIRRAILSVNNRFALVYPNELFIVRQYWVRGVPLMIAHGSRQSVWRWESLAAGTKEPETLDWIDKQMGSEDVLFDIGACVGNYSLYAAARHSGLRVFAFEPEPNSMINLVHNVARNDLPVTCCQIPLSASNVQDFFHCNPLYCREDKEKFLGASCFIAGESNHQFGRQIKSHGVDLCPSVSLMMGSCTVDELVNRGLAPAPNHIKMDVDGLEPLILSGMQETLRSPALRTLLCEVSTTQEEEDVRVLMEESGFYCALRAAGRPFGNRIYLRR